MEKKETKKKTKSNVHEIVVKIDGDNWKKAVDKAYKKQSKDAKVDCFQVQCTLRKPLFVKVVVSDFLIVFVTSCRRSTWP